MPRSEQRWASYEGARESLERLKSFGINFVYTHNYGCEPGSHLSFAEILRAADDVGMLVAFSQPHFGHYDWQPPDADQNNGYARHAEFYVRAGAEPSLRRGLRHEPQRHRLRRGHEPRHDRWHLTIPATTRAAEQRRACASRAEAIVKRLDPGRIVYHHSSGNLGSMHTMQFLPEFRPRSRNCPTGSNTGPPQGVKPVFTCEYGAPFSWDWAMYRGWYNGQTLVRQRSRCPGNSASPNGIRSSSATGLPDERGREGEPALGSQEIPGRQALASVGLSRTT